MNVRNKLIMAASLFALSGMANAAIVSRTITSGNWDSIAQWTANATGTADTTVYDNGQTPPCINCVALGWSWLTAPPAATTGTYGGTLLVDDVTNAVVGGSLVVTGTTPVVALVDDCPPVDEPPSSEVFVVLPVSAGSLSAQPPSTAAPSSML